ncbi:MAG: heavy-metal-associated domain-containing protein [Ruminiclostridium sp.]|nr:heavy-metal-associated domain-containing protein [Ruminiclostridium sp.]
MPILVGFIVIACAALIVLATVRRIRRGGGCCGEHEGAPKKIRPADRDKSHYPYRYTARVEGIVCANCVRRVENSFNSRGGIYAKVNTDDNTVMIYSKSPLERREAAQMIDGSYYLADFVEA